MMGYASMRPIALRRPQPIAFTVGFFYISRIWKTNKKLKYMIINVFFKLAQRLLYVGQKS